MDLKKNFSNEIRSNEIRIRREPSVRYLLMEQSNEFWKDNILHMQNFLHPN
jgi:hypothetical protein